MATVKISGDNANEVDDAVNRVSNLCGNSRPVEREPRQSPAVEEKPQQQPEQIDWQALLRQSVSIR